MAGTAEIAYPAAGWRIAAIVGWPRRTDLRTMLLMVWLALGTAACQGQRPIGSASSEQICDPASVEWVQTDAYGRVAFCDRPGVWRIFRAGIAAAVQAEANGQPPPRGLASWNAYWLGVIANLRAKQENAQGYASYLIQRRRQAGLPEIGGGPGDLPDPKPALDFMVQATPAFRPARSA